MTQPPLFDPEPTTKWTESLLVFDTETTGVDPTQARIVTASLGLMDGAGEILQQWQWLIDPGVEIPEAAQAVHGISTEHAREHGQDSPTAIAQIVDQLRNSLEAGATLVVYNAPYDLGVLGAEAQRHGLGDLGEVHPVVDPLVIDKHLDRYRRGKRTLEVVSELYGVALDQAHDAGADAKAAGLVALELARRYPNELNLNAEALHQAQVKWHDAQADDFEDYMRRVRDHRFQASRGWPTGTRSN